MGGSGKNRLKHNPSGTSAHQRMEKRGRKWEEMGGSGGRKWIHFRPLPPTSAHFRPLPPHFRPLLPTSAHELVRRPDPREKKYNKIKLFRLFWEEILFFLYYNKFRDMGGRQRFCINQLIAFDFNLYSFWYTIVSSDWRCLGRAKRLAHEVLFVNHSVSTIESNQFIFWFHWKLIPSHNLRRKFGGGRLFAVVF